MSRNNFNITVFRRKCREVIFRKRKVWKKKIELKKEEELASEI